MAKRGYVEQVRMLAEAAAEAAGVEEVDTLSLLAALVKRLPSPQKRSKGVPRYQGMLPLSPGGLRDLLQSLANRRLANRVARMSLRVFGHDATIQTSFPLYRAFALRLNLEPWSQEYYRRHAFGFRPSGREALSILA